MPIKAILFDVIGTTVMEKNSSVITTCFQQAFHDHGITANNEMISTYRGKDKREAIKLILTRLNQPLQLCQPILDAFLDNLERNLKNFSENSALKETLQILRQHKIVIGIGTGLPEVIFQRIFDHLNWSAYEFDYIGIAEKIGRGRPHPDMIINMMNIFKIAPSEFLKVGDTVPDIQEGKNAKVYTAAILSGTTAQEKLKNEKPDFIIHKLPELIDIVKSL